jgi:pimeloyl-ACP methyl ester carboxylesterase
MPSFHNGSVQIAYLDEGEGDPIVLVHGFASTKNVNWVYPSWTSVLTKAGRRVIALDNRGHGASGKLYEASLYDPRLMAGDALALLSHLGLERADLMGYSMGGRIGAYAALAAPGRVRSLILGGIGVNLVDGVGLPATIADALLAPSLADVSDQTGRMFRAFAEQTGSDRRALAACIYGTRQRMEREDAMRIAVPTLIAVGTRDVIAGDGRALAALIPGAQAVDIPGRDHMLAVGDKVFKQAVLEFLANRP